MSREKGQNYYTGGLQIERIVEQNTVHTNIHNEERRALVIKREYPEDEVQLQRIAVKEEIVNDTDSENERCYIYATGEDMEIVQLPGNVPYLRSALSFDNTSAENNSNILLVDASSNSPALAVGSSYSQEDSTDDQNNDETPVYIELCSPKKTSQTNDPGNMDFGDHFILQNTATRNDESADNSNNYDSEIVIYPVQKRTRNMGGKKAYLQNRGSVKTFIGKNVMKGDDVQPFTLNRSRIIIRKSIQRNETHPFKCMECNESFELKSHFVMHELGHAKYKFYSFRTNTVKCICIQCKKPFLYSANNQELNSNMCIPCVIKLRKRMSLYNMDKGQESGVKRFLDFPEESSSSKVKEKKECYSCGRRANRYFVYGASLLCNQCWQDRTQRAKRSYSPMHTSQPYVRSKKNNPCCKQCLERFPYKSQLPYFRCEHLEENPLGTHFLLSASAVSSINKEDEEFDQEWGEIGISAYEEEPAPNNVVLCERTGEFIDKNVECT